MTTNLDVLYRYELHPTEAAMIALGKLRGVYGIRKISLNEQQKTMRVEFDFTRLTRDVVADLLRSAGIDVVEEIPSPSPPRQKQNQPRRRLPPNKCHKNLRRRLLLMPVSRPYGARSAVHNGTPKPCQIQRAGPPTRNFSLFVPLSYR